MGLALVFLDIRQIFHYTHVFIKRENMKLRQRLDFFKKNVRVYFPVERQCIPMCLIRKICNCGKKEKRGKKACAWDFNRTQTCREM